MHIRTCTGALAAQVHAMLIYIALCLAATLAAGVGEPTPQWSPTYTFRSDYYSLEYDDGQPGQHWYDDNKKITRSDAFGGINQRTVELNQDGVNATVTWIYPVTTEEVLNTRTCSFIKGPKEKKFFHGALPDMKHFNYTGKERIHGVEASRWQAQNPLLEVVNEVNVWITYKDGVAVPIKLEYTSRNIKQGTIQSRRYYDIYDFDPSDIDPEVWNISKGLKCEEKPEPDAIQSTHVTKDMLGPLYSMQDPMEFHTHKEFIQFKQTYNKGYSNDEEFKTRRQIFAENLRLINEHNNAGHSYQLGVNQFADRTKEELAMMLGHQPSLKPRKAHPFPYTPAEVKKLSEDLPEQFDWRLYGAVTPVKEQISCASCYAHAAVGVVEGALFLKNASHPLVRFSEQAIVDCSWGFGNIGCSGGLLENSYEWMMKHGVPTYEAYGGYQSMNGYCHIDNMTTTVKVKEYFAVPDHDEKALKVAVFKNGPISVAIDAGHLEFYLYTNGVLYIKNCNNEKNQLNHAVLVVGYGELYGEKYWLVKNSWGSGWGIDGFALMSIKDNNCGVMSWATYATVE